MPLTTRFSATAPLTCWLDASSSWGDVSSIHMYSSMVTITFATTEQSDLESVVSDLFTYYVPGVEIPDDEELIAMVPG